MENYTYTSYADSGESSPRSRELEFENSGTASWEDQPLHQSSKLSSLINKLCALCEAEVCFKYQLPREDLDALISVTNDDDLERMMHDVGSCDMKTEGERFFEALNSGLIQSVDATSPPATAPPSNVDFLFGLDKGVSQPAPVPKLPVPVESRGKSRICRECKFRLKSKARIRGKATITCTEAMPEITTHAVSYLDYLSLFRFSNPHFFTYPEGEGE
ncbi:hypothetical protein CK203_057486 [Vitis vinifera]|uniref:PB1 domain-containing protein n=1 Tax=Vitis vinifera TaxID=29760 RepID=A0A438FT36_VITVI|nr:hypothetical protein CK203_057486 [Vitis vinifera]